MKDIEIIEELLNGYIDGELDERKTNEIKRLIDHNEDVQQLFDSLSRYKKLMGAVRPATVPEGFSDSVTRHLERHILLADTGLYHHKTGKRRLILRHLLTAAAIIVLMAMLSFVVFDVFVPKSSREKLISSVMNRKQKPQVLYEKPFANVQPPQDEQVVPVPVPKGPTVPLIAKLTLLTNSPVETDWLVGKALMNTGLSEKAAVIDRKTNSVRYVLNCGKDSLVSLISELSFIWPRCSDVRLEIGTENPGKYITVNNITSQQAIEICRADNYSRRIRMANDISIINGIAAKDILEKYFAQQNTDTLLPEKPVLTSSEKPQLPTSNVYAEQANLTILVVGN